MANEQRTRDPEDRVVSAERREANTVELALRPRKLFKYIGQVSVRDNLSLAVRAALGRGEPLAHTMLYGPPGLGKTTLARILATEMGTHLRTTSGPAIARPWRTGSSPG